MTWCTGRDDMSTSFCGWSLATGAILNSVFMMVVAVLALLGSFLDYTQREKTILFVSGIVLGAISLVTLATVFSRSVGMAMFSWVLHMLCLIASFSGFVGFLIWFILTLMQWSKRGEDSQARQSYYFLLFFLGFYSGFCLLLAFWEWAIVSVFRLVIKKCPYTFLCNEKFAVVERFRQFSSIALSLQFFW